MVVIDKLESFSLMHPSLIIAVKTTAYSGVTISLTQTMIKVTVTKALAF
jgi:hypothetical protein